MYLVKGEGENELELHIADKDGQNTRSTLSREDVNVIFDNKISNIDFTKIEKFTLVFKDYFIELFQNFNIDISQINDFEYEIKKYFDLFIQSVDINITQIDNFEQEIKQYFDLFIQNVDINQINNFEPQIKQYFDLFIQHVNINISQIKNFDQSVKNIIKNTNIDVNNIINIDQRILEVLDGSEHTSRLEVKNTYQELKQLAEDKKLNKNQLVFVVDATSPEAKVDKGSATFLYQVPDHNSRKKIEQTLLELKRILAEKGIFDKELQRLIADGYDADDLKDILQAKNAVHEYFVNKDHADITKLTIEKNAILDFKDLGLLISNFVQTWNIFQSSVPKELHTSKSSTVFKLKNLIEGLSDNYENFVAHESTHKIIKVAEHESMDLKFEVKWGDIQDIPEPINKIITGQVLLQAVEW